MKKLLAIVVVVVMVCALSVSAFADGSATVSASFTAYSTGNQYDTLKPMDVGEGIVFRTSEPGTGHIDITALIEQVADLENVTSIEVTLEAVGKDAFQTREDGGGAIVGLKGVYDDATNYDIAPINWGTTETPYTMSGELLDGTVAVYVDTSSHGQISINEPWEFKVTVTVNYVGDAKIPVESTEEPATEDPAPAESGDTTTEPEAPAETGIVLAVLPMAIAAAAVVVSKKR